MIRDSKMKRTLLVFSTALFLTTLISISLFDGRVNAWNANRPAAATPSPTPPALGTPTPKPSPSIDDPNEIIKIDTELVNLTVRVVDRNNHVINNIPEG